MSNKSVACVHAAHLLNQRKVFVKISLAAKIAVLVAVCTVLIAFSSSKCVVYAWGPPSSDRGILLSIYFAILFVSILLLMMHFWQHKSFTKFQHRSLLVIPTLLQSAICVLVDYMLSHFTCSGKGNLWASY